MFASYSFNHNQDISTTYPCKTIEISKVTLTKNNLDQCHDKVKDLGMAHVAETCSLV